MTMAANWRRALTFAADREILIRLRRRPHCRHVMPVGNDPVVTGLEDL
jgi:hypothetical protein